jgi:hypothetical protein
MRLSRHSKLPTPDKVSLPVTVGLSISLAITV